MNDNASLPHSCVANCVLDDVINDYQWKRFTFFIVVHPFVPLVFPLLILPLLLPARHASWCCVS